VFERYPPDLPLSKLKEEFDATVIEWIVSKLWNEEKRDILKISNNIKRGWKKIKREVFSSFLLVFVCPSFLSLFSHSIGMVIPTSFVWFVIPTSRILIAV
jgi:hypothetical protein